MPPAAGLMTTLGSNAKVWRLVVYQALLGVGSGIGFQGPQVAVQTVFENQDAQIGIAVIQFAQGTGPAVFLAAAQAIFLKELGNTVSDEDLHDLTGGSAREAAAKAFMHTFYLPVALACLTLVGALSMEWRSVKTRKR